MAWYYTSHGSERPPNFFVKYYRRLYRPLGFTRGYNPPLWFIFGGALFAFVLFRAPYLAYDTTYKNAKLATGDWYFQKAGYRRVAMLMHLGTILPAGLLVPWQFVPAVRHHLLLAHRLNGYVCLALLLCINVTGLMLARYALGGNLDTQLLVGLLSVTSVTAGTMGFLNIKRQQLDQHRAWMLRTWFYAASIITLRIVQLAVNEIISEVPNNYQAVQCRVLASIYQGLGLPTLGKDYPSCVKDPNGWVAAQVNINAGNPPLMGPPNIGQITAATTMGFGTSGIVALFLHMVGVEIYLRFTPKEAKRLRQVSYERQLERGYKHPGEGGVLMVSRWGDSDPFVPERKEELPIFDKPQPVPPKQDNQRSESETEVESEANNSLQK